MLPLGLVGLGSSGVCTNAATRKVCFPQASAEIASNANDTLRVIRPPAGHCTPGAATVCLAGAGTCAGGGGRVGGGNPRSGRDRACRPRAPVPAQRRGRGGGRGFSLPAHPLSRKARAGR